MVSNIKISNNITAPENIKTIQNKQKKINEYICEYCNFKCSRSFNWRNHIITKKHQNKFLQNEDMENIKNKIYKCNNCDKIYTKYKSFWNHKNKSSCNKIESKKCNSEISNKVEHPNEENNEKFLQNIIKDLLEQNKQYANIIENLESKSTHIQTQNNIQNNIQNKFNLNIFLNEECKDAFNMSDFIDMIQLTLKDLEVTARMGYTDGITKIIKDKINDVDVIKRPFHCTDIKREVVYVKDNDVWEKENSDKPRMKKMISNVIHKNLQQLSNWQETYPECTDLSNKKSEEYLNIMIQANGGNQIEREKKEEKIMKNICKEILVDK